MASSVPVGVPPPGGCGKVEGGAGAVAKPEGAGRIDPTSRPDGVGRLEGFEEGEEVPQRKKTTSFKITNVFLSRPPSNDGDESAEDPDDLDDSHTEELSDIADSLSSQLENVAAAGHQVNGLPQVKGKPEAGRKTSDQRFPSGEKGWDGEPYVHPGFGFVAYNQAAGYPVSYVDNTTGQLPIGGTMAVIVNNSSEKGAGVREVPVSVQPSQQDFRNRFKIVKVETTEPLKRGRWTCFDFVDKPAAKEKQAAATAASEGDKSVKSAASRPAAGSRPASVAAKERPGETAASHTRSTATPAADTSQGSAPASGAVSEEREVDKGHLYRQSNSVPPDALRTQGASYHQPPHSISLPTQPNLSSLSQVQSPHGLTSQLIGQIIRLENGQLAQVALAPYNLVQQQPQQPSQSNQSQQQVSTSQGYVILQPLPSGSNISNIPQQQVLFNATGQMVVGGGGGGGLVPHSSSIQPNIQSNQQQQQLHHSQKTSQQQSQQQQQLLQQGQQSQQQLLQQQQNQQLLQQQQQQQQSQQNKVLQAQQQPHGQQQQQNLLQKQQQSQQILQQQQNQQLLQQQQAQQQGHQQLLNQNQQQQQQILQTQQQQQPQQSQQSQSSAIVSNQQVVMQQQSKQQQQQQPSSQSSQSIQQNQNSVQHITMQNQPSQPILSQTSSQQQQQQLGGHQQLSAQQQHTHQQQKLLTAGQHQQQMGAQQQQIPGGSQQMGGQQGGGGGGSHIPQQQQLHSHHSAHHQQLQQPGLHSQAQNGTQTVSQQVPVVVTLQQHTQQQSRPQPQQQVPQQQPPTTQQPSPASRSSKVSTTYTAPPTAAAAGVITAGGGSYVNYGGGVYPVDGEGLVERLEEISLLQEEGKEGQQEPDNDSASGAGQGTIDNRIEQAMDLVKSHLMSAVRSEVEELRDRITKLEETNNVLYRENEVLRANVNPDVLASISGRQQQSLQPPDPQQPGQH